MLTIRLLGPPSIAWQESAIEIPRRSVRALLYFLAAQAEPVAREELCHLFWGDEADATARSRLRHTLSQLRQALEVSSAPADLILATSETAHLDLARTWIDYQEWSAVLSQARDLANAVPSALEDVAARLTEMPAGSFLQGFLPPDLPLFETWVLRERDRFENARLEALVAVASGLVAAGQAAPARRLAEAAVRADPLREEAHVVLIDAHAASGERSAALRQYELMKEVLERELGVAPLPESEARYRELLGQSARPAAPPPSPRIGDIPFIGREKEITLLNLGWQAAREGAGRIVIVCGVAGLGKSRLLSEFVAGLEDAHVLEAACYPSTQGLPYYPWIEALRPTLEDQPPDIVREPWRNDLLGLLPLSGERPGSLANDPAGQARLWEAVARHLRSVATTRPVILVLNDVQWADPSSLQLLAYLTRRLVRTPFLLLSTARTEDLDRLRGWREEIVREPNTSWIDLEPLTEAEVLHLVQRLAGLVDGGRRFSLRLHRETEGNPFYLIETLRQMLETGQLLRGPLGWQTAFDGITEDYGELPLPESVREAIRSRFAHMSPLARQILGAAAVLGREFDSTMVRLISGRSQVSVVEGLDTLRRAWVIRDLDGAFRFAHGKFQEVAYEDLGPARRQLLHRRTVDTFSRGTRPARSPAEIAYHARRAEMWAEAADNYRLAADAARQVFAFTEVAAFEAGLIEVLARISRPPAERLEAWLRLEHAHHLLGERDEQVRDLESLAGLGVASPGVMPELAAELEFRRGRLQHASSRWREAAGHLGAAVESLPVDQPSSHEASLLLASCWSSLGEVAPAEATARGALAHAEAAENPRAQAACALALADIADQQQKFGPAKEWLALARKWADQAGDRRQEARSLYLAARAEANTGAFAASLELAERGRELARPMGLLEEEANCLRVIGIAHSRLNRPGEAAAAYRASQEIYRSLGRAEGMAMVELNLSDLLLRIADFPTSAGYSRSANRHYGEINSRRGECASASNHGQALLWMGRAAEAVPWFEQAEALSRSLDLRHWLADILGYRGLTELALGNIERARACFEESLDALGTEDSVDRSLYQSWLALGLLRAGETPRATDIARRAAAEADGRSVDHVQVQFVLGMALHAAGDAGGAATALDAALAAVQAALAGLPDEAARTRYRETFPVYRLVNEARLGAWPDPPRLL